MMVRCLTNPTVLPAEIKSNQWKNKSYETVDMDANRNGETKTKIRRGDYHFISRSSCKKLQKSDG